MNIHSLGQLTDMHLIGKDTQHITRHTPIGDYVVVHTPSNPEYFWGNYVLFSQAFLLEDTSQFDNAMTRCRTIFTRELTPLYRANTTLSAPEHVAFAWDNDVTTPIDAMVLQKMQDDACFDTIQVLTRRGDTKLPDDIGYDFRKIDITNHDTPDSEWQQLISTKIAESGSRFNPEEMRGYIRVKYAFYRQLIEQGKGYWFGAFKNEKLVASFGIFIVTCGEHETIARFQSVDTHPDYRRQGICRNLIRYAMNTFADSTTFCIITDAGSDAERVYRSVGFAPTEVLHGYCDYDRKRWDAEA